MANSSYSETATISSLLHLSVGRGNPQILNHRRWSAGDDLGRHFIERTLLNVHDLQVLAERQSARQTLEFHVVVNEQLEELLQETCGRARWLAQVNLESI